MTDWDPRALAVLDALEGAGFQAVLVGGCVRDALRGAAPHDYDAATAARPEEMRQVFAGWKTADTGLRHGTLTVFSGGLGVEVTSFRSEGPYSDRRRPDGVRFTRSLAEDLGRRDFTVNAMAWGRGGLTDLFGGREDLAAGVIRCVGSPARRFQEDALRLLRGLRLAAQLEFKLHPDTAAALRDSLPLLDWVSRERVMQELSRLVCAPGAQGVLLDFPQAAVRIFPELAPAVGFDQRSPCHCFDVYTHCVRAMGAVSPRLTLRLAALLHDVGKPAVFAPDAAGAGHFPGHARAGAELARAALRRLRLDGASRERTAALIARHGMRLPLQERAVRRQLFRLGPELFFDLAELDRADNAAKRPGTAPPAEHWTRLDALARQILAQSPCLTLKDLAVDGHDALAAGLEGPAVGRALDALLEAAAEGRLPNRREDLLRELERRGAPSPREG
ncbi:MAG: HD domain-containing protein [Lawsonibacter sp.]|nr:HD domain-containing protein [Lawsonibacter sp.]